MLMNFSKRIVSDSAQSLQLLSNLRRRQSQLRVGWHGDSYPGGFQGEAATLELPPLVSYLSTRRNGKGLLERAQISFSFGLLLFGTDPGGLRLLKAAVQGPVYSWPTLERGCL